MYLLKARKPSVGVWTQEGSADESVSGRLDVLVNPH